jgi:hypothetical protein
MANKEQLNILKQGVQIWNEWRKYNPNLQIDLSETSLSWTNLNSANLCKANLSGSNLWKTDLCAADLTEANLSEANLRVANLRGANLRGADLRGADLTWATLNEANLSGTSLIGTNFTQATLSKCRIFGISAWNVTLDGVTQSNLIITDENEPEITVDDLEVAQFIYLMLNNKKIRNVIDTITSKAVLILGRFTDERKAVLDAMRDELRRRNYLPILFDFEKPANRDLTETIMTLAGMARFVIADLSDPHSIPHELMTFGEKLLSVPIQAIFCPVPEHKWEYPMYEHLRRYPHVLPIYRYDTPQQLLDNLSEKVIDPAEAKVIEMKPKPL